MRVLVVGVALLVAACGGPGQVPTHEPWSKTAGQTSCADWMGRMDRFDRQDLALGMLEAAWERAGAAGKPSTDLAVRFGNAIGSACQAAAGTQVVSELAASLYVLLDDLKP